MSKPKVGNKYTTIKITWEDKERLRRYAQLVKKTKKGEQYEKDETIFNRIIVDYMSRYPPTHIEGKPTYPQPPVQLKPTSFNPNPTAVVIENITKDDSSLGSQDEPQQDSNLS